MRCPKYLSFEECELHILRNSMDLIDKVQGEMLIDNPDIQNIIKIVETFMKENKTICYGGTAINNILPEEDQFYNKKREIPDYDFFSPNALEDAKKLAKIYYNSGFKEVEAKSGIHKGTYKVFVNFIPVADITYIPITLYKTLLKKSIIRNNIYYCPPNYLRMSMYLELSRPQGDISRWEKVMKRLRLLNKHYPINEKIDCNKEKLFEKKNEKVGEIIKKSCIDQGLVFFGYMANELYEEKNNYIESFNVLSSNSQLSAIIIKEELERNKVKNIEIKHRRKIGEIIPDHYEIRKNNKTLIIIFDTLGCHNYNIINIENQKVKIATIDTILSFYLAFIYVDRQYLNKEGLICMSEILYKKQQKNIRNNRGIYKRYSISCYGKQETLESMRSKKAEMYKKLKKGTKEFNEWFLRYIPQQEEYKKKQIKKNKTKKNKTKKNKTKKNKK
jgi:hypothetical protein